MQIDVAHRRASAYYETLFLRSNSLTALFESVYHTVARYRVRPARKRWESMLSRLEASLGRARRALLYGPPVRVLRWLESLQDVVERSELPAGADDRPRRRLADSLLSLRAEILDDAGDDLDCFRLRMRQVFARIGWTWGGSFEIKSFREKWRRYNPLDPRAGRILVQMAWRLKEAGRCLFALQRPIGKPDQDTVPDIRWVDLVLESLRICRHVLNQGRSGAPSEPARGGAADGMPAEVPRAIVRGALEMEFGCRLVLADSSLDSVYLEVKSGHPFPPPRRRRIDERLGEAEGILRRCSRSYAKDYGAEWAALKLRLARVNYLWGWHGSDDDLARAYDYLQDARAEAYAGQGDEDLATMAEVRLHTAAMLLTHTARILDQADRAVERVKGPDEGDPKPEEVTAKLRHTSIALDQAKSTLMSAFPKLRGWRRWEWLIRFTSAMRNAGRASPAVWRSSGTDPDKAKDDARSKVVNALPH